MFKQTTKNVMNTSGRDAWTTMIRSSNARRGMKRGAKTNKARVRNESPCEIKIKPLLRAAQPPNVFSPNHRKSSPYSISSTTTTGSTILPRTAQNTPKTFHNHQYDFEYRETSFTRHSLTRFIRLYFLFDSPARTVYCN